MSNLIETCCICGNKAETKKVLPLRDLIGSGVEIYNIHVGICKKCGFIFNQTPLTAEQFEARYKNESKYEYDTEDNVFVASKNYKKRCAKQKFFIDEYLASERHSRGGGSRTTAFWKLARRPVIISAFIAIKNVLALNLQRSTVNLPRKIIISICSTECGMNTC